MIDTRPHREVHPVGKSHGVFLRCLDRVVDEEKEKTRSAVHKVANPSDNILAHALPCLLLARWDSKNWCVAAQWCVIIRICFNQPDFHCLRSNSFPPTTTTVHAAKGVPPKIVRGQSLDGREDNIVDTGPQHEVNPVGRAQRVLLRRHNGVADEEEEELDQPRDKVAGPGDDVLVRALPAHVAPARGRRAPVVPDQFGDDDEEEQKLCTGWSVRLYTTFC